MVHRDISNGIDSLGVGDWKVTCVDGPGLHGTNRPNQVYTWSKGGREQYDTWWRTNYEGSRKETDAAWDAISRLANTTWWEWTDGSRCMHWRWSEHYRGTIRDGIAGWFKGIPEPWTRPQQRGKSPEEHERMKEKLQLVRAKRYIRRGQVTSLTSFFGVPKGLDDTRMVYDGTKSGLNDALWVPSFPLPTGDTML